MTADECLNEMDRRIEAPHKALTQALEELAKEHEKTDRETRSFGRLARAIVSSD